MKEEAIELKDSTQESLVKEEIEETNSSKKRDFIIKECRSTNDLFQELSFYCERAIQIAYDSLHTFYTSCI